MVLLAWMPPVIGSMVLDRTIIRFVAGEPSRQDVLITNSDAETLYLKVEVFEVKDPGTPSERREKPTDPNAITLLATPNKMIVPPGGRKLVRLVNLGGHELERIYRVNVTPVVADLETTGMAVYVVVAYQLLVIVTPEEPAVDVDYERIGKQAIFTNRGNTNALLHSGEQCPPNPDVTGGCVQLEAHRLYAGNIWKLELPYDAPFEYSLTIGKANTRRRFD
jgi:P pilus assembly chaperone PapD